MHQIMRWKDTAILAATSIVLGLVWRVEVEWHGWAGLGWIDYFHWAVPLGSLIFLAWAAFQTRGLARQSLLLVVIAVIGVTAFLVGRQTMYWAHNRWIGLFPWWGYLYLYSPVGAGIIVAGAYFGALRWIGGIRWRALLPGIILYAAAFPLAVVLLAAFEHKGGADSIHAIKSGFVFTIISFALGLPLVMPASGRATPASTATPSG